MAPDVKHESALPSTGLRSVKPQRALPPSPPDAQLPPHSSSGEGARSLGSVAWQRSSAQRFPAAGALWGVSSRVSCPGRAARALLDAQGQGARLPRCWGPSLAPPTERSGTAGARAAEGAEGSAGRDPFLARVPLLPRSAAGGVCFTAAEVETFRY